MGNMASITIPGPGSAMAIAAAVSIYSATKVSVDSRYPFFVFTVIFIGATIVIEGMHIAKELLKK